MEDHFVIGPATNSFTIRFTAVEPEASNGRSALARVACPALAGTAAWDLAISGSSYTCTYPLTSRPAVDGMVSGFELKAWDNFGNLETEPINLYYDLAAPQITVDFPDRQGLTYFVAWRTLAEASTIAAYSAKMVVSGQDCAAAGTTIALDGKERHIELANDVYRKFCLRATDGVGNVSGWVTDAVPGQNK